jgi:hypothetical protein
MSITKKNRQGNAVPYNRSAARLKADRIIPGLKQKGDKRSDE